MQRRHFPIRRVDYRRVGFAGTVFSFPTNDHTDRKRPTLRNSKCGPSNGRFRSCAGASSSRVPADIMLAPGEVMTVVHVSIRPGWTGAQPSAWRVMALDATKSPVTTADKTAEVARHHHSSAGCSWQAGRCAWRRPRRSPGTGCPRRPPRARTCRQRPFPVRDGTRMPGRAHARQATGSRRLRDRRRSLSAFASPASPTRKPARSVGLCASEGDPNDRRPHTLSAKPRTVVSTTLRDTRVPSSMGPLVEQGHPRSPVGRD